MKEIRETLESMWRGLHIFHLIGLALTLFVACLSFGNDPDPPAWEWGALQTAQAVQSIQNARETAEALVATWEPTETPTATATGTPFDQAHGTPFDQAHGTPFDQAHGTPAATSAQHMPEVVE